MKASVTKVGFGGRSQGVLGYLGEGERVAETHSATVYVKGVEGFVRTASEQQKQKRVKDRKPKT